MEPPAPASAAGAAQDADSLPWYCLRSQPKHEQIAAQHLRKFAGIEVFSPMLRFERIRRQGKLEGKTWVTEAIFPSYIFAQFDLESRLREIKHSHGISGIVHFGGLFPTVPPVMIEQLRAALGEEETVVVPTAPVPGQEVTLIGGAFSGLRALVTQYFPAKERVRILLMMLGRGHEVDLPVSAVAADRPRYPLECG